MAAECDILLVAVNARYGHCAFAARSLLANLGPLRTSAALLETDLQVSPFQLADALRARRPRVAGFSVYLWNRRLVRDTLAILRTAGPCPRLVLGGPEITADDALSWHGLADDLVTGEGESVFRRLCGEAAPATCAASGDAPRIHRAPPEDPAALALPYDAYTDTDIARRTLYIESSRGCPYACAYCTSAGTGLRLLPLDRLLPALDGLLARGARAFRLLDRSFNAPEEHACRVLDFFLTRRPERLRLHAEILPHPLGEGLRRRLAAFPPGALHLEVGIQTLNPAVAGRVGRTHAPETALETLRFLAGTGAALHVDLLFGLPGEDERSFAEGFDRLVREFDPPELQVNLLKRLPGTRLAGDPAFAALRFHPNPPYELLASDALDFEAVCRMQHVARVWELVHNRGAMPQAAAALRQDGNGSPYARYSALAERILAAEARLYALDAARLKDHVAAFLADASRSPCLNGL